MLTYTSSLQDKSPVAIPSHYPALETLRGRSPYGQFGQNHQDVLGSLVDSQVPELDMQAYRANTDYSLKQQEAQRQLTLAGLQQQADAQRAESDIATSRLQAMTGVANSLLSGLFG